MSSFKVSEKQTRYSIIDSQLKKAGWNLTDHTQVGFEIPVTNNNNTQVKGFSDFCPYKNNGEILVLVIVEVKRTGRNSCIGIKPAYNQPCFG